MNVDGGYSFYAMEHHAIKTGVLVDLDFTPAVLERQKKTPRLKIIHGNFGDPLVAERIGRVDAAFFFDTLLHQVNPNWDAILEVRRDRSNFPHLQPTVREPNDDNQASRSWAQRIRSQRSPFH